MVEEVCPDQKKKFENISFSARMFSQRIEDLGDNLSQQLREKAQQF